jgi:hypothetical protein
MIGITPQDLPMGMPGEWKPRFLVTAPLVVAKDVEGHLRHAYQGSRLGWLNDEQRDHFLSKGLVTRIEDSAAAPNLPAAETIGNCIAALDSLGVDRKNGAPTCRGALRDAGHKFSNETVAAAVKERKQNWAKKIRHDDEAFEEVVL